MNAGGMRSRTYSLEATLSLKDNASAQIKTIGESVDDLHRKISAFGGANSKAKIGVDGAAKSKAEVSSVNGDLDKIDGRTATAEVKIKQDKKSFSQVEKDLKSLDRYRDHAIEISTKLEDKQTRVGLKTLERNLDSMVGRLWKVKLDSNSEEVIREVDRALIKVESLTSVVHKLKVDASAFDAAERKAATASANIRRDFAKEIKAKADLDVAQAMAKAESWKQELDILDGFIAKARASADVDRTQLNAFQAELQRIQGQIIRAIVKAELVGDTEVKAGFAEMESRARSLNGMVIDIKADLDSAPALAGIELIKRAAKSLEQTYGIKIDVSNIGIAKAAMLGLVGTAQQLSTSLQALTPSLGALARGMYLLQQGAYAALVALIALAAAASGPLLAGLVILVGTVAALAGGFALLAAAAAPMILKFASQASAQQKAAQTASGLRNAQVALASANSNLAQAQQGLSDAYVQAEEKVTNASRAYTDSLANVEEQERQLAKAQEESQRAFEGIAKAEVEGSRQIADAQKRVVDATRQYQDSLHSVDSQEKQLLSARHTLEQATKEVTAAQEELNRAMNDEPLRLDEMELDRSNLLLDQKQNTLDLAQAEEDLAKARSEGDSLGAQNAQLEIERLQLSQQQNAIDLTQSEEDLADARANGTQELQSAQDAALSASDQQQTAQDQITENEYQLQKAYEDSQRAYEGIGDAQQGVADAQLSAQEKVDDATRAYQDSLSNVENQERQVQKAREESSRAYDGIAKAQTEGAKDIEQAQQRVAEAEARVADASLDLQEKMNKAALEGNYLAQALQALPPALQPLAATFFAAFEPASILMEQLTLQAAVLAQQAMPSLGLAALQTGQQFQTALGSIGTAFTENGVLQSMQVILGFIPQIFAQITEASGYAFGGIINFLGITMPFVSELAGWLRDISYQFLQWTASEAGRQAIFQFLSTAAPIAKTLGGFIWEIARGIVSWSVEHAAQINVAIQAIASAAIWAGTWIGVIVTKLLEFAIAHPTLVKIAAVMVLVGTAVTALGLALIIPVNLFFTLWGVGTSLWTVLGLIAVAVGTTAGVLAGVLVIALYAVIVAAATLYNHWTQIIYILTLAQDTFYYLASVVSEAMNIAINAVLNIFINPLFGIFGTIFEPLIAPFRGFASLIPQLFGTTWSAIGQSVSTFLGSVWAVSGQAILNAIPAPFRLAVDVIIQIWNSLFATSSESGFNTGKVFADGLLQALHNMFPALYEVASATISIFGKIADAVPGYSNEAADGATTAFDGMSTDIQASIDATNEKMQADFSAMQADITAKSTAAQQAATEQSQLMLDNVTNSSTTLGTNVDTSMIDTYNSVYNNTTAANTDGSYYMDSLNLSGSGSMSALNQNSVAEMLAANTGISSNLDQAQQSGTGSMTTLHETGTAISNEIFRDFTNPIWTAAVSIQEAFNAMLYGMGQVIQQAGLSLEVPEQFMVVRSPEGLAGGANEVGGLAPQGGGAGGHALGGLFTSSGRPTKGTPTPKRMATGGTINPNSLTDALNYLDTTGQIPPGWYGQQPIGGIAEPMNPRVVYGEAKSPEAYIVANRPTHEQLPYLIQAASWHGYNVVPDHDEWTYVAPNRPPERGSSGGSLPSGRAGKVGWGPVAKKFMDADRKLMASGGVIDINAGLSHLSGEVGKPYVFFEAIPLGADCAGIVSEVARASYGLEPYSRDFSTTDFGPDYAPSGWIAGWGQHTTGVTHTGGGDGGDDDTHMSGQIGSTTYESIHYPGIISPATWQPPSVMPYIWHQGEAGYTPADGGGSGASGAQRAKVQALIEQYLPSTLAQDSYSSGLSDSGLANQIFVETGKMMLDAIKEKLISSTPAGGGAAFSGAVPEELRAWVQSGMELGGVMPLSMLDDMVLKAMEESSGNPQAVNNWDWNAEAGHPSKGLYQIIESTWESYTRPDIGSFEPNWADPVKNTAVASRIMMAQAGQVQFGPYSNGGLAFGPHMGMLGDSGPEMMVPLTDQRAVSYLRKTFEDTSPVPPGYEASGLTSFGDSSADTDALIEEFKSMKEEIRTLRLDLTSGLKSVRLDSSTMERFESGVDRGVGRRLRGTKGASELMEGLEGVYRRENISR